MQTSNFKLSGHDPKAVAISRSVPKWYTGERYISLAPASWALVREKDEAVFRARFLQQLEQLDAAFVVSSLDQDAILLCWEAPGEFCHRRVVAEWLERETGLVVPELYLSDPLL